MPEKLDPGTTSAERVLRLLLKLMWEGRRHFQLDLAEEFQCAPSTIIRMMGVIESIIGTANLEIGLENRKRWYQIKSISRNLLGLETEELRYLSICRDLACNSLPEPVRDRIENTIFHLSVLMADRDYAERATIQKQQIALLSKGYIDYTPHQGTIEKLLRAAEERRFCLVRYKAAGKTEAKEHRFAPGRIVSMSGTLYILGAGMTEDFKEIRHSTTLAIHRITDLTLTERCFSFDVPEPEHGSFGLPWHEPRTFRVRFTPGVADYVRERIWAGEQRREELADGGLLLEITTRSEPEFMAWVRSFGEEAEMA